MYWATTDVVYWRPSPGSAFAPFAPIGVLEFSADARVVGPAAGDNPPPTLEFVDTVPMSRMNLVTKELTGPNTIPGANYITGLTYNECRAGGIRLVPDQVLTTTEAGGTAEFTAVLTTKPLADVTVSFKSSNRAEGKVRGRPLVFTPDDWFVPRTVRVAGVPDGIADGTQTYTVTASSVTSADPLYDRRAVGSVTIQNIDDDPRPSAPESRRPR